MRQQNPILTHPSFKPSKELELKLLDLHRTKCLDLRHQLREVRRMHVYIKASGILPGLADHHDLRTCRTLKNIIGDTAIIV